MADKKNTETINVNVSKQETKYKLRKLRDNSRELFNVSTSTFDGATFGLNTEDEFTKPEIKEVIDRWLKQEVKA